MAIKERQRKDMRQDAVVARQDATKTKVWYRVHKQKLEGQK